MPHTDSSARTPQAMRQLLVRYADLQACRNVLLDKSTAALSEQVNFTIIGPAVLDRPLRHTHIREDLRFVVAAIQQPFGYVGSQYSLDTAEVLVVHTGHWRLHFGPNGEYGSVDIGPGDAASIPPHIFRGCSRLDEGEGFLWMLVGYDDPAAVTCTPVSQAPNNHGKEMAQSDTMIDTTNGTYELKVPQLEPSPILEQLNMDQLNTPSLYPLTQFVALSTALQGNSNSPVAAQGIQEAGVIVPQATPDGFAAGIIAGWWQHNFNLRRLTLQTAAYIPLHSRCEVEVLFVQSGTVEIAWPSSEPADSLMMGAGDTLLIPAGMQHSLRNTASCPAVLFVVRGSEQPQLPVFASAPIREFAAHGA